MSRTVLVGRCPFHGSVPFHWVCIHLLQPTDCNHLPSWRNWIGAAVKGREVLYDWMCKECARKKPQEVERQQAMVCMHCCKVLQIKVGFVLDADGILRRQDAE